jgi:hypothetical protein
VASDPSLGAGPPGIRARKPSPVEGKPCRQFPQRVVKGGGFGVLRQPERGLQGAVEAVSARGAGDLGKRARQGEGGLGNGASRLGVPAQPSGAKARQARARWRGPENGVAGVSFEAGYGGLRSGDRSSLAGFADHWYGVGVKMRGGEDARR